MGVSRNYTKRRQRQAKCKFKLDVECKKVFLTAKLEKIKSKISSSRMDLTVNLDFYGVIGRAVHGGAGG